MPALLLIAAPHRAAANVLHRAQVSLRGHGRSPLEDAERRGLVVKHRPLFEVIVNFEIEDLKPAEGVTMVFDKEDHSMRLDEGIRHAEGLAWARYDDHIRETGWAELYAETSASANFPNDAKMYGVGYAEGILTCVRLSEHFSNSFRLLSRRSDGATSLGILKDVYRKQLAHLREKAYIHASIRDEPPDAYWKQVRYVVYQLWGLCDGYNYAARHFGVHTLTLEDLFFLNTGVENNQKLEALMGRAKLEGDPLDLANWQRRISAFGGGSAMVRLAPGNKDMLVGHSKWDDYSKMTRIFKYYNFPLKGASTTATLIGFSSYPGVVSSTDDFYVMNSGLCVMETPLQVLDPAAWEMAQDYEDTPSVPVFAHVMAVNRIAATSAHWAGLFRTYGPIANAAQWAVVDYNEFQRGSSSEDHIFWLVESLPGVVEVKDLSSVLKRDTYFPLLGRPYFEKVRKLSGHASAEATHGAFYSWKNNTEAKLFAKELDTLNTPDDMRMLMATDHSTPAALVRMDLAAHNPLPFGAIDAKVTSHCLMKGQKVQAFSGPSYEKREAFAWDKNLWSAWPHTGQPNVWNFGFVEMGPTSTTSHLSATSC